MNNTPFAYGIQAPIGSVTPLFHKRKDAEDYIAKLTDSRDVAKIIPLYREPPVYALSGNAENVDWADIAMVGRAHADNLLGEPGITELMHVMANEIERLRQKEADMLTAGDRLELQLCRVAQERDSLREAIRRLADQDATLSVRGGNVTVTMDATLTPQEREAVEIAVEYVGSAYQVEHHAAVLRGLLERPRVSLRSENAASGEKANQVANCDYPVQDNTPKPDTTPTQGSVPPEWMNVPYWVDPPSGWQYGFPRLYDPAKDGDMTAWLVANGYPQHLADKGLPCTFTSATQNE